MSMFRNLLKATLNKIVIFLIGGSKGITFYSANGKDWKKGTQILNDYSYFAIVSACYGKDRFIIGTNYNEAYYSKDGIHWTKMEGIPSHTEEQIVLTGVCYGKDRFVTVGNGNKSFYSTDGETWTASASLSSNYTFANYVCYGGNRFVCVGDASTMPKSGTAYSTNGETWTTIPLDLSVTFNGICYGNEKFVAIGKNIVMYYSNNSWTSVSLTGAWNDICYGNNKFVAVGRHQTQGYAIAYYSEDGITWTAGTGIDTENNDKLNSVTYDGKIFVAIGDINNYYSEDGISWTKISGLDSSVNVVTAKIEEV